MNDNFCPIPWIHSSVNSFGNFRVCCVCKYKPDSNLHREDGTQYNAAIDLTPRNHEIYKEMRVAFLQNKKHKFCRYCWELEEADMGSNRMWNVIRYGHYYDDIVKYTSEDGTIDESKIPIAYYDLRLGNKCNCKCIICGPVNSSMWRGSVYDWTNNLDTPYLKEIIEKAESIEKIYFTGGEPMINEHHWNMLDIFIKNSHNHSMEIDYNTNGVVLNEKMFQIWSQFKSVDIGFSIDGIYEIFEKIRYPAKWKTIEKNLKLFEENATDTIHATLAVTVSSINILNIIDLYKWAQEQNFKKIRLLPHFNVVSHPDSLNFQILDPTEKDKIKEEYEIFYLWLDEHCPPHEVDDIKDSFKGLINMMYLEEGA